MIVTKLSPQKKKGRFNVFLDGKYAFALLEDDLVKEGLKIGQEIGETRFNELKFKGQLGLWFIKILNFLSFRPRSEKEIVTKLKEFAYKDKELDKSIKDELIEAVVQKTRRLKLLDDEAFARWYVEGRQNSVKPMGRQRIKSELLSKGVTKDLIDRVLKSDSASEESLAYKTAEKKLSSLKATHLREFKTKLSTYLIRRGFSWDAVSRVVDTIAKRKYNRSELDND